METFSAGLPGDGHARGNAGLHHSRRDLAPRPGAEVPRAQRTAPRVAERSVAPATDDSNESSVLQCQRSLQLCSELGRMSHDDECRAEFTIQLQHQIEYLPGIGPIEISRGFIG